MINRMMWRVCVAVLLALAGWSGSARGEAFSFVSDRLSLAPGVTPGAFLTDSNVAEVDAFLAAQGAGLKVIKIADDVSAATVASIYGKYRIDYTFADFEGPGAVASTRALVNQIRASAVTGPAVVGNQAFVGNYHVYSAISD